jgi:hypothetical protein
MEIIRMMDESMDAEMKQPAQPGSFDPNQHGKD